MARLLFSFEALQGFQSLDLTPVFAVQSARLLRAHVACDGVQQTQRGGRRRLKCAINGYGLRVVGIRFSVALGVPVDNVTGLQPSQNVFGAKCVGLDLKFLHRFVSVLCTCMIVVRNIADKSFFCSWQHLLFESEEFGKTPFHRLLTC